MSHIPHLPRNSRGSVVTTPRNALVKVSLSLWAIGQFILAYGLGASLPVHGIPGPSLAHWMGLAILGLAPPLALFNPSTETAVGILYALFFAGLLVGCMFGLA